MEQGSKSSAFSDQVFSELSSFKSVLVFLDVPLAKMLFGSLLDCAVQLLHGGTRVIFLRCSADLTYCLQNEANLRLTCGSCKSLTSDLKKYFPESLHDYVSIREMNSNQVERFEAYKHAASLLREIESIDELQKIRVQDVNLGAGVVSSLVQIHRDRSLSWEEIKRDANRILSSSLLSFKAVQEAVRTDSPGALLVGNGRFATMYGATAAAELLGLECFALENPESRVGFRLVRARLSQDVNASEKEILDLRQQVAASPLLRDEGLIFYQKQRFPLVSPKPLSSLAAQENIFVQKQRQGSLPDGFDTSARNIVFFGTSFWEYEGLPGWESPFGITERNLASLVCRHPSLSEDSVVWYREHPHSAILGVSATDFLVTHDPSGVRIIPSGAEVDSYKLIENSTKVVTFGSTIGIESVYWGKESILCGVEPYQVLGQCERPKTVDELVSLLNSPVDKSDRDLDALAAYGLFRQQSGRLFKVFEPTTGMRGSIGGVPIAFTLWWKLFFESRKRLIRLLSKLKLGFFVKLSQRKS